MEEISKSKKGAIEAIERGYRVDNDGNLVNPKGKKLNPTVKAAGYKRFSLKMKRSRSNFSVAVHQLVAIQKFGVSAFLRAECVRHLDGNPTNNAPDNIQIGTNSQNMMDRSKDCRARSAKIATSHIIRKDWDEIDKDRSEGMSYRQLEAKHGVGKGTLSYHFSKVSKHRRKP